MNTELLKLSTDIKIKIIFCISLFITYTTPIHGLLFIVGFAVLSDTVFGLYGARKKGIKIQSNLLFNTAVKTFFYMGSIFFGFLISKYMTDESLFGISFFIPKFLCGLWIYIEVLSLDETSISLGNRPFLVVIKELIKKLKDLKTDVNEIK